MTDPLDRLSVVVRFDRARIGRWVPVAWCRAALASADAVALAGAGLGRVGRDRAAPALVAPVLVDSHLVVPALGDLGPARHDRALGRARVAPRVMTIAVHRGATETRGIGGRRHVVTVRRVTVDRRREGHRLVLGVTFVTTRSPHRDDLDRLAICCTDGTPS
jgi:hypothetical protein